MEFFLAKILPYLVAILGLSILVVIHEAGHYFLARSFGMRVLRFSIGFGPVLAKFQPKGSPTTFQISAIPFLAYVQIAGMNPAEDNEEDDPALFPNQGVLARTLTIFAGPFANYMTASFIAFGLAMTGYHQYKLYEPMTVDKVVEGGAAAAAGMKAEDVIVKVGDRDIKHVRDLQEANQLHKDRAVTYTIRRGEQQLDLKLTPSELGLIGVQARQGTDPAAPLGVGDALTYAVVFPAQMTIGQIYGLYYMAKQRDTSGVKGPKGIVDEGAKSTRSFPDFLRFLMLISVALGFFNLLPFPALDGGRLVFLGYEIITRRRPNQRVEGMVHLVGMMALLSLLLLVTLREVGG